MSYRFIKLDVTKDDIELAESYAIKQRNAGIGIGGTSKFQTSNPILDHTIGHIGQIKFDKWLTDNSIEHKYHNKLDGHGDKCDFEINNKTYDVKTGQLTWNIRELISGYNFQIAKQQIDKPIDYYINAQLDNLMKYVYITGWLSYDEIKKYPIEQTEKMCNPACIIPITDLHNIDEGELFKFDESKQYIFIWMLGMTSVKDKTKQSDITNMWN